MEMQKENLYKHSVKFKQRIASLYIQNTGCQHCSPNYGWGPGVRNHFLLHHVVSGKGVYVCRNQSYRLSAGDTFLIYPDTTIHYYADAQDPWEYIWVGFSGLDAVACMEQTDFTPANPVLYGKYAEELRSLIEDIYTHNGASPWEGLEMTARLYILLAFLIRVAEDKEKRRQDSTDCAQLVADYIINHYEEPITVEGLAAYASVSHSSLYRRFVKRFQVSPKRFLMEYRIERACALLTTTNCSIQEISNSVGFDDPFYFSRAFKDIKGVSPRQYAGSNRAREPAQELESNE